jgi:hypothetical protein
LLVGRLVSTSCTLDIAGITIALTSDGDLPIAAEGSARKFVRDDGAAASGEPEVRIHARWGDPREPAAEDLAFDSGKGLWRFYRTAGGPRFSFTSAALGPLPYQTASFNDDFTRGEVLVRREIFGERLPLYPLHYPLDEVLMVHLLSRGRGVEVHGSGIIMPDGTGTLFVGQSGAGKTTMSKMWLADPDVKILSDERIIVRQEADGPWMYGTPWHGDGYIANQGRARLKQVFFLRHGAQNAIVSLARTQAVARLFACGFTPFHDASGLDFTLQFLDELSRSCRCDELWFKPDRSAVAFVRAN